MANISLRLTESEKLLVSNYAKMHGMTLSDVFKKAFFEKLEEEHDLKLIKDFENDAEHMKTYTISEVGKELGL